MGCEVCDGDVCPGCGMLGSLEERAFAPQIIQCEQCSWTSRDCPACRCSACDGSGKRPGGPVDYPVPPGGIVASMTLSYCEACGGHGSARGTS